MRQPQVWQVESGTPRRRLSIGEAFAFASVFEFSLAELTTPPGEIAAKELIEVGRAFNEWRKSQGLLVAGLLDIAARVDELSDDAHDMAAGVEKYGGLGGSADVVMSDLQTMIENIGVVIEAIKQDHSAWSVIASMRDLLPTETRQPVVAVIVTSGLGVLVGRRNDRTPPWGFISGEVEPDELPADAAVREVKEETGLEVRTIGPGIGERDHPVTGRHMLYLAAEPLGDTEVFVGDEAELAEVRWVSLTEADELLPDMFAPVHDYLAATLGAGS